MSTLSFYGWRDERNNAYVEVMVDREPRGLLDPFKSECYHGDFEWGYYGSGPAQLAYAIVRTVTGCPATAGRLYQEFKHRVISALPHSRWVLTEDDVWAALSKIDKLVN